jgi:hypothetical protein
VSDLFPNRPPIGPVPPPPITEQVEQMRPVWTFMLRMSDLTTHYHYARAVNKDGEPEEWSFRDAFLNLSHQIQTHRIIQVGHGARSLTDLKYVCGAQVVSFELAGGHD